MAQDPIAFWSYAHADDSHEGGRISELRTWLSGEVLAQSGAEFPIFHDKDIGWGERWKQRIDDSLDGVTFLIPVITPTFFGRKECLREVERFLEREEKLGRKDLILPIYYIDHSPLNGEVRPEQPALFAILRDRQYFDLRNQRHEPLASPEMKRLLSKLAKQLVDAVDRPNRKIQSTGASSVERSATASKGDTGSSPTAGPASVVSPPTHIVDAMHRGDFASIAQAVAAAKPGDRIIIRRGTYPESIIIDKPLELVGDGELGEVVIETTVGNVIRFQSSMGRLANLTIRKRGPKDYFAIDVSQGRLDIDGCDITGTLSCIGVRGGADPRLRRNRIHHGGQAGVFFFEDSMGTLEDNEIYQNTLAGVEIKAGSNPTLRRNRIRDGMSSGIYVQENGLGLIEGNEIFGNKSSGLSIATRSNPTVIRNKIFRQRFAGIFVYEEGEGIIEDNEIYDNGGAGIEVKGGGNPQVRNNSINRNTYEAVWIHEGGKGTYEANDLKNNERGPWDVAEDCTSLVSRSGNIEA